MRPADIPHLAQLITNTGQLLDQRGAHALTITRQWQPGPGAANTDSTRSPGVISDPTGNAALGHQPDPHTDLIDHIRRARAACIDLTDILHRVGTPHERRTCWWLAQVGVDEPAPHTIDGRPASTWVYRRWSRTGGQLPTVTQLRARANGQRRIPTEPAR